MNKTARFPTSDEIAVMNDDELNRRFASLNGYIERERRRGNEHVDLETDYCFLFREVEIRNARREAHNAWVANGGHLNNWDEQWADSDQDGSDWAEY